MNKSLLALIFAVPFIAACWSKKNAETVDTTPAHQEEMVAASEEMNQDCNDAQEESDSDMDDSSDEK